MVLVADEITNNSDSRNKIMEIMIDTVIIHQEVSYFEQVLSLEIKDIFCHNTLGNRKVNK